MEEITLSIIIYKIIRVLLILLATLTVNKLINLLITKKIKSKINGGSSKKKRIETLLTALKGTSAFIVLTISILIILLEFGVDITALLAGVGILTLAIGMASRDVITDFISGIFILIEGQYDIGDDIKVLGVAGKIIDFSLRKTVIKDDEGLIHFIPNGQIKIITKKQSVK
jgi:moderate conductance mechanosensitive channel